MIKSNIAVIKVWDCNKNYLIADTIFDQAIKFLAFKVVSFVFCRSHGLKSGIKLIKGA